MLFLLPIFICKEFIISQEEGIATISFDEGPSKNIPAILDILSREQIVATFYFDATKINDYFMVDEIVQRGHTVGLAIVDDLDEIVDVDSHILCQKTMFMRATGYVPKFVRLPRIYYGPEHVRICESHNMIVTRPNLDSEDLDLDDFITPLAEFVFSGRESSLSVVFRDRIGKMVANLSEILNILSERYEIVSIGDFYRVCSKMEAVNNEDVSPLPGQQNNSNSKPKEMCDIVQNESCFFLDQTVSNETVKDNTKDTEKNEYLTENTNPIKSNETVKENIQASGKDNHLTEKIDPIKSNETVKENIQASGKDNETDQGSNLYLKKNNDTLKIEDVHLINTETQGDADVDSSVVTDNAFYQLKESDVKADMAGGKNDDVTDSNERNSNQNNALPKDVNNDVEKESDNKKQSSASSMDFFYGLSLLTAFLMVL